MGQPGVIHSFADSLEASKRNRDPKQWEKIYRVFFPTLIRIAYKDEDGRAQRLGIDTIITLENTRTIYIDEKERNEDYGDIFLEYYSAKETKSPGWVAKNLACDYIAYLIKPTGTCYMLPFQALRRAWRDTPTRFEWLGKYRRIPVKNVDYTTVGIAVPANVVLNAIMKNLLIKDV